jgi:hypothetical protein
MKVSTFDLVVCELVIRVIRDDDVEGLVDKQKMDEIAYVEWHTVFSKTFFPFWGSMLRSRISVFCSSLVLTASFASNIIRQWWTVRWPHGAIRGMLSVASLCAVSSFMNSNWPFQRVPRATGLYQNYKLLASDSLQ